VNVDSSCQIYFPGFLAICLFNLRFAKKQNHIASYQIEVRILEVLILPVIPATPAQTPHKRPRSKISKSIQLHLFCMNSSLEMRLKKEQLEPNLPNTRGFRLSQHVPHSFLGNNSIPRSIVTAIAELRPATIFTTTTGSLAKDRLQVTALGVDPAANEVDGILAQGSVEGVASTGVRKSLDD
jgi:hypothetical protein